MESAKSESSPDQEDAVADRGAYHRMRGRHNFQGVPRCVYYYHLVPQPDGDDPYVTHYYYTHSNNRIPEEDIEEVIRKLGRNARKPKHERTIPACGEGEKYIVWSRKSYIVVLIDDDQLTLEKDNGIEVRYPAENLSLFDGTDVTVDLSDSRDGSLVRTAVWCINHMKNTLGGGDMDTELQRIDFTVNTSPRQLRNRHWPDSGGTNMGPPVPPP